MRWLIDGYNVMYAAGVIDSKMSRERFRRARRRFLDELAEAFGDLASETTVVFDANKPPADFPLESTYRGVCVLFALSDRDADARIERILAKHSTPKALTVVSNDREVRQSATRRKAKALKADDFLDRMKTIAYEARPPLKSESQPEVERVEPALDDEERAYWQEVFGDLELDAPGRTRPRRESAPPAPSPSPPPPPDHRRVRKPPELDLDRIPDLRSAMLTDADIAEIRRQVEQED